MGKKYLDTKPGTLESSVINVWKNMVGVNEEEVEITEAKISKELASKILSMRKTQKFVKASGDLVPKIYLSAWDRDKLKAEFGKLPRGLPNATKGVTVADMINYALGKDRVIDTEGGNTNSPKLISWDKGGKVIGRPKTVGDAAQIAGVRLESVNVWTDAIKEQDDEYKKVFQAAMKKFGVKSPAEFKDEKKKKEFFDYVDAQYKAPGEKPEPGEPGFKKEGKDKTLTGKPMDKVVINPKIED